MLINHPKIGNIAELFCFIRSLFVFLSRSNFVSIYSLEGIMGLLDCNSGHNVLSSVVSVLVCASFVFLNT